MTHLTLILISQFTLYIDGDVYEPPPTDPNVIPFAGTNQQMRYDPTTFWLGMRGYVVHPEDKEQYQEGVKWAEQQALNISQQPLLIQGKNFILNHKQLVYFLVKKLQCEQCFPAVTISTKHKSIVHKIEWMKSEGYIPKGAIYDTIITRSESWDVKKYTYMQLKSLLNGSIAVYLQPVMLEHVKLTGPELDVQYQPKQPDPIPPWVIDKLGYNIAVKMQSKLQGLTWSEFDRKHKRLPYQRNVNDMQYNFDLRTSDNPDDYRNDSIDKCEPRQNITIDGVVNFGPGSIYTKRYTKCAEILYWAENEAQKREFNSITNRVYEYLGKPFDYPEPMPWSEWWDKNYFGVGDYD